MATRACMLCRPRCSQGPPGGLNGILICFGGLQDGLMPQESFAVYEEASCGQMVQQVWLV